MIVEDIVVRTTKSLEDHEERVVNWRGHHHALFAPVCACPPARGNLPDVTETAAAPSDEPSLLANQGLRVVDDDDDDPILLQADGSPVDT